MQLLVVLPLLVVQQATAGLVGTNACLDGPAYWCENIPQAKQCGAVNHCITAVWEKQSVPEDTDQVCDICKDMVGQARDTLESNETQEELREVFEGSCNLIPLKVIAKECRTLADEFVPELVETLASQMNPDTVCTVAGLCNSARIDKLLAKRKYDTTTGCEVCREKMSRIEASLETMSDQQVEMKLLEMCGYMGSYSDACRLTVTTQLETIVTMLRSELTRNICDSRDICSSIAGSQQVTDDLECEFCSKVVKHWVDKYASDASLAEFKSILDGICDKLDSKNSAHCKNIVDNYYMPVFEYIRHVDPHLVCSFIGLCGNKGFFQVDESIPINTLLTPAQTVPMVPLTNALQTVTSNEKPTCVVCEYIMNKLQSFMKDTKNEDEIKEYLDSVCEVMPSSLRKKCDDLVDAYEPLIVQLLVDELSPTEVCQEIKLCDKPQVEQKSSCATCQFVADELFAILSNKEDENMVRNVLDSICYRLPSVIDQPCENFVDKYANMVMEVISTSLTPDQLCQAIDLCDEETTEIVDVVTPQPDILGDSGCVLCEYVISNIDKMLKDRTNEQEIEDALESVCSVLPSSVTKQCDEFVEQYTNLIIQLLTGEVTPEEVCKYIGLCKPKQTQLYTATIPESSKSPYCSLCEYALLTVDQMLQDKKTEEEIENALDVVCYQLSAPVHKQCLKMVNKYTEEIIQLITSDYSPQEICSMISLCVNSEISTNDVHAIDFSSLPSANTAQKSGGVGCVMCEFAMEVLDEHLDDEPTIDQVERVVLFLCSYLPGTIADQCETFVNDNAKKIIDGIVHKDLDPQEVCTIELNMCDGQLQQQQQIMPKKRACVFGPDLWCATPFHAQICDAVEFCQVTSWNVAKVYNY